MRIRVALLACALAMPATAAFAAEKYMCTLTIDGGNGIYKQDTSQHVALSIDQKTIRPQIHIRDASKDLTFATCKDVAADGSNFSRWFKTECRDLKAVDGSSYTIEPFLVGAYAGISPVIDKSYSMYGALESISKKSHIKFPKRTFAIYADRKPVYEFLCYAEKRKP
jgi:hypothetical protein